jgi:type III pantothenate kinase
LTHETPLPIKNLYATPQTLGCDRLAAVVGAAHLYPNQNLLVIDAGTAITYELLSAKGEYLGGNISPGISLRFKALHHYTGKLPLCERADSYAPVGTDTQSAIAAGVLNGVLYEVQANVEQFSLKIPNLIAILTGGDADFFANRLKKPIFVVCDLVLIGLNRILEHVHKS